MAGNPKLEVEIVGDARKLNRTLKETETSTKRWAKRLENASAGSALVGRGGLGSSAALLKGGGLALGAGFAANEVAKLSDAASDLNEQITKSEAVFGRSSAGIQDWSRTTAGAIGVSRTAALEATGTFGNLFNTVGIVGDQAGSMSKALVELGADLASFNNADPSEVLDAIRSGLIGEAEPLRRFGVLLSEARVQQRALADTGKTTAKSLTDQEKALARYEIIMNDTKKAQGDFGRTSGGLANQQRILKARFADTRAELGTKLLPIMVKATEGANKLLDAFEPNRLPIENVFSSKVQHDILEAFGPEKLKEILDKARPAFDKAVKDFSASIQPIELTVKPPTGPAPAFGQPGFKVGDAPPVPLGPTPSQRNRWFDSDITRRLDKVQDISTIKGQIGALTQIAGLIQQRIAVTKDITRKLNLEDQLRGVNREKRGLQDQIARNIADAAAERARRTREAAEKEAKSLSDAGDTIAKGLTSFANKIKAAKNHAGPLTQTTQLSTDRILDGLGLGRDAERTLRARLSHFNSAGLSLTGAGAGSQTIVVKAPDVYLDGAKISKNTSKNQARARKLNPGARNGPNSGSYVGA